MSLEMVRAGECGSGVQLSSAEESPLTLMSPRAGSLGWSCSRATVLSLAERSVKQMYLGSRRAGSMQSGWCWQRVVQTRYAGWGVRTAEEVRDVLTHEFCAYYSET